MSTIDLSRPRPLRAELAANLAASIAAAGRKFRGRDNGQTLADALLTDALRERATDVHVDPQETGVLVRFRIDGHLHDAALLPAATGLRLIRHFKAASGMELQHFMPANTRLTHELDERTIDLRLASVPCVGGEKLSIRLLDRKNVEQHLDDLGLRAEHQQRIETWLANTAGMFLVTGPVGSGKTTTLYAVMHELRVQDRCVVTVEEPIEYQIAGITQTQVNRKHGLSFAEGLRAMLRLDADYLLLGEIRDEEAARAAAEAADTGRVLLSTLHSPDAVGAVTALRNFGLADHEIAASLRMVVAQRLVRRLCPACRRPAQAESAAPQQTWIGGGCEQCRQLGYQGRIGLFEVWQLDDDDRGLILAHADEGKLRSRVIGRGFQTLLHDGYVKATEGLTSFAEVGGISASYPHPPRNRRERPPRQPNGNAHALDSLAGAIARPLAPSSDVSTGGSYGDP